MDLNTLAGIYTLRLKAKQGLFENLVDTRDFKVEIVNPCHTSPLTIDEKDEVFKLSTSIASLTTYVSYAPKRLEWDDNIVTSTMPSALELCGAHTMELW